MADADKKATVKVPTEGDSPPPAGSEKEEGRPVPDGPDAVVEEKLSEEDEALKASLEEAVAVVVAEASPVAKALEALETLRVEIQTATSSMTAVPKPLKFLRPHYAALVERYGTMADGGQLHGEMADLLSVLAMTMGDGDARESLAYKLAGNSESLGDWGHEYVRNLAGEISREYAARVEAEEATDYLLPLVARIVPFHLAHNAEAEAVDLLLEVQQLPRLLEEENVDDGNFQRVALYLLRCADYMSDPEELAALLDVTYNLYLRKGHYADAVFVALRLRDRERATAALEACDDSAQRSQLAYIFGRTREWVELEDHERDGESLAELASNMGLSDTFAALALELDVVEAKTPEDIYKSHLAEGGYTGRREGATAAPDSARHNLASTFVNAFVNAGFLSDKLMTAEGSEWLTKNRAHAMLSATASLGLIYLWNEEGLMAIDKYLYSGDDHIRAGALLGVGVMQAGVHNDSEPALAILSDELESKKPVMRNAAALGLGISYAGSEREELMELLGVMVEEAGASASMTSCSIAALALGMVYVGSCNDEAASIILARLMEASELELNQTMSRFMALGLALIYMGAADRCEPTVEALKVIPHARARYASVLLQSVAYAGTGSVLTVQSLLHLCAEHVGSEKADAAAEAARAEAGGDGEEADAAAAVAAGDAAVDDADPTALAAAEHQSVAVLGIALVAMAEPVGADMAVRAMSHLLQYGEPAIRRSVPLALALLHLSDPKVQVMDTLSKLTHDPHAETAQSAILALGLIGAGTNNSRIAQLLRSLAAFYAKEAAHLFMIRIAQGLLHMGKGLITLSPALGGGILRSQQGLAGILVLLSAALDVKHTLLEEHHYLLFALSTAMQPRMLFTVDEDHNPLPVTVRVGTAVDTVGQAGRPKTITGFQTHTTPVLLGVHDRAELASEEYIPLTSVLEGYVVLRKNPEWEEEGEREGKK